MKKRFLSLTMIGLLTVFLMACSAGDGSQTATSSAGTQPQSGAEAASTTETTAADTATTGGASSADAEYVIKMACNGVTDPAHPQNTAMTLFKELVEEHTGGRVFVELYFAGSLGDARTIMEGVQLGTIEMGDVENGPMSGFVPEACLWDMPYLFTSLDHAHKVLDGEVGQQIAELYSNIGVKHLAYNDGGFRYLTNGKRAVNSMADMSGLKIRVMESAVMIDSINAFGASAVPMAFGEVYTALSQGTVDGQENPLDLIYAQNYYEVQQYLSRSEHFYYPRQYIINKAFFDSLPADIQQIIQEDAITACQFQREETAKYASGLIEELESKGMEICDFDKTDAIAAAESVWQDYYDEVGGGDAAAGEALFQKVADLAD